MSTTSSITKYITPLFSIPESSNLARMAGAKKVSQEALRQMMQKLKADKGKDEKPDLKRKYKLSSKEVALLEQEKRRKQQEVIQDKKDHAKKAGVPETFFDSAKTKAFLNLNKAPQKSILKNSSRSKGGGGQGAPAPPAVGAEEAEQTTGSANAKASGKEWTSSAPVLTKAGKERIESSQKAETAEMPADFFDKGEKGKAEADEKVEEEDAGIPAGFFDDPIKDAKVQGKEYKNPEDLEWEAFQKEIAVEVRNPMQSVPILCLLPLNHAPTLGSRKCGA